MLHKQGRDLDYLPYRKPQLRGKLVVGSNGKQSGKSRFAEHCDYEYYRRSERLVILSGNFKKCRRVKPPPVVIPKGAVHRHNEPQRIGLKGHKHIFARVGVHHKGENALYPLPFLFIHICGIAPAVCNFKPVHSLLFDVSADLVVALLDAG